MFQRNSNRGVGSGSGSGSGTNSFLSRPAYENRDIKTPKQYNASQCEFPELIKEISPVAAAPVATTTTTTKDKELKETKELNFTGAIQKEKAVEKESTLKPGHVSYTLANRKIVVEYGPQTKELLLQQDEDPDLSENDAMNLAIDIMKQRWDAFKNEFIESYGEDEYIRLYKMPMHVEEAEEEEEDDE